MSTRLEVGAADLLLRCVNAGDLWLVLGRGCGQKSERELAASEIPSEEVEAQSEAYPVGHYKEKFRIGGSHCPFEDAEDFIDYWVKGFGQLKHPSLRTAGQRSVTRSRMIEAVRTVEKQRARGVRTRNPEHLRDYAVIARVHWEAGEHSWAKNARNEWNRLHPEHFLKPRTAAHWRTACIDLGIWLVRTEPGTKRPPPKRPSTKKKVPKPKPKPKPKPTPKKSVTKRSRR